MIKKAEIDNGRGFDWGRASRDYARYRDIYPREFYQKILDMGACVKGQRVLDMGTGTGVLPRNLYPYGAAFTGIDISENQIQQAILLAEEQRAEIDFFCMHAEKMDLPDLSFDVVTACQCFTYFDHEALAPRLSKILCAQGRLIVLYMAWLPFEDPVAGQSEALVLKYNPEWTGCGEKRHPIAIPEIYSQYFTIESQEVFDLRVPFSRESWNGRMKACRGIEASLPEEDIAAFDAEHRHLLAAAAPEKFKVRHYAAISVLRKR
ncbi:class I SAM-dependent methyltransferase [Eubacterium callanderi]|uniref:class I SAM-dependent methyltransferase n=1 Tax=Eubacterium callanderi TaxID=53442 RepID=UPI0011DD3757|nr:class I SAM-dependent methyltransferase [Eubacterium callanderi]WPK76571.1 Ubiquinone biosynthesis O-methyltransferase, mitochondrial [Eubacterium callanderi]